MCMLRTVASHRARRRQRVSILTVGWIAAWAGCEHEPPRQTVVEPAVTAARLSPSERYARLQSGLQDCYAVELSRNPLLTVDVLSHFVVRGDRVTYVDVDIPPAPQLATCAAKVIKQYHPLSVHPGNPLSLGSQRVRIDKQGRLPLAPSPDETNAGFHRFLARAVAASALRRDEAVSFDPVARDAPLPAPPPPPD